MTHRILKSALALTAAFTLAACPGGDTVTGPQIELTETQREDMMDALEAIGSVGDEFRVVSASIRASLAAGASGVALATFPIDETEDCPNGGTTRAQGSMTLSDDFLSGGADVTQTYNNCQSQSSTGTMWTFNSAPSLRFVFSSTSNASGTYSGNGSMKGTINVSSSMGSGACTINITYTESGDDDSWTYTASGTICGEPFSETESDSF